MDRQERKKIKQDEFVEQTWNVLAYVEEHPKAFLYGAAALVVAIVAIWSATGIVKRYAAKSSDALLRGQTALEAPVARAAARPSDPYARVFSSVQERARVAAQRLAEAEKGHGAPSLVAIYLRGVALLEGGDAAGAAKELETADAKLGNDPTLGSSIKAALAQAYAQSGQAAKAADIWRALVGAPGGYPRELALYGLGQALEGAGRADEAKAAYRQALDAGGEDGAAATSAKAALSRLGA